MMLLVVCEWGKSSCPQLFLEEQAHELSTHKLATEKALDSRTSNFFVRFEPQNLCILGVKEKMYTSLPDWLAVRPYQVIHTLTRPKVHMFFLSSHRAWADATKLASKCVNSYYSGQFFCFLRPPLTFFYVTACARRGCFNYVKWIE